MSFARPALAVTIAIAGALVVAFADGSERAPSEPRLPDLLQRAPAGVFTSELRPGRFYLVFPSSVENVGDGPMELEAMRSSTATPTMTADQLVLNENGSTTRVEDVGRLRYVRSPDHSHWHYLDFDRYTLRRLNGGRIGSDHKTGFCLGDRYAIGSDEPPQHPVPGWSVNCGAGEPRLLAVREGISVGFGDDYPAALEGQAIEITDVAGGRYRLVHQVNARRLLEETAYENNVAAATVQIKWPNGRDDPPSARVIATCEAAVRC